MDPELASKPLTEYTEKELKEAAKSLGLGLTANMPRDKMVRAVEIEKKKRQLAIEDEAREQLKKERMEALGFQATEKRFPNFEEIAIYGGTWQGKQYPPSKKLIVEFFNNDDPDSSFGFTSGGHYFELFQADTNGAPLLNVMPECLVSKAKEFQSISLAHRGSPIYKDVEDTKTGRMASRIVGYKPRFRFPIVGDAPKDAPFGLYSEESKETIK